MRRHLLLSLLIGLAVSSGIGNPVTAQEPGQPAVKEEEAKRSKYHRLPPFYGDVVTDEQKDTIYSIQDKYGEEISALEQQLLALIKKRNAEIEAVLSAQQKQLVDVLAAEAAKQRDRLRAIRAQIEAERKAAEDGSEESPGDTGSDKP